MVGSHGAFDLLNQKPFQIIIRLGNLKIVNPQKQLYSIAYLQFPSDCLILRKCKSLFLKLRVQTLFRHQVVLSTDWAQLRQDFREENLVNNA